MSLYEKGNVANKRIYFWESDLKEALKELIEKMDVALAGNSFINKKRLYLLDEIKEIFGGGLVE